MYTRGSHEKVLVLGDRQGRESGAVVWRKRWPGVWVGADQRKFRADCEWTGSRKQSNLSFARLAGDEMNSAMYGRPSLDFPSSTSFTLLELLASNW